MRNLSVDDVVRLISDVPHLNLRKGQSGVVRSLWSGAAVAYEVEFTPTGLDERTRAFLLRDQLALAEDTGDGPGNQSADARVNNDLHAIW